jgi:hypothetical protein
VPDEAKMAEANEERLPLMLNKENHEKISSNEIEMQTFQSNIRDYGNATFNVISESF